MGGSVEFFDTPLFFCTKRAACKCLILAKVIGLARGLLLGLSRRPYLHVAQQETKQ